MSIRGKKTRSGHILDQSVPLGNVLVEVIIFDNHQNRVFLGGAQ